MGGHAVNFCKGKAPADFGFRYILYAKEGGVAKVTFNRPDALNSYCTEMLEELRQAFRDAAWDDAIGVLVLTGAGDRAFCTCCNDKAYAEIYTKQPHEYWKYMGLFQECHDALRNIGKPTVARINGIVAGGGNEFNLACDLAVMADHATIRQVGTMVGSVAAGGATQWLPIMVGDRRAREILWLCEPVPAAKCLDWGLVNQVVPSAELDGAVDVLCRKLLDKFPECMRYTKQQTNFWKDLAWHQTIGHAREWLSLHFGMREPYEGMTAFAEKRPKDYAGIRKSLAEGGSPEFLWGPPEKACPKCGAKGLPGTFVFCGACGTSLGAQHART